MCYGTCGFEDSRGECCVQNRWETIEKETGLNACFIGGNTLCPEQEKEKEEMDRTGELQKLRDLIVKKYYR